MAYGNIAELNSNREIVNMVGEDVLTEIAGQYLDLLDTSAFIIEKNGDFALKFISSNWCIFLDESSRRLCRTRDNKEALINENWFCNTAYKKAAEYVMNHATPYDIECSCGLRIYAVPIKVGKEIVGTLGFTYGEPPKDKQKLHKIAEQFQVEVPRLVEFSSQYETRPPFIIELAKSRLITSAKLIGVIFETKRKKEQLQKGNIILEHRVKERTTELLKANELLKKEIEERKKMDKALQESEEQYRSLIQMSPDVINVIIDGKLVFTNQAGEKLFETTKDKIIGHSVSEFLHPDYIEANNKRLSNIQEHGITSLIETKLYDTKGNLKEVEAIGTRISFDGKPAVLSVVRDISARKQHERIKNFRNALLKTAARSVTKKEYLIGLLEDIKTISGSKYISIKLINDEGYIINAVSFGFDDASINQEPLSINSRENKLFLQILKGETKTMDSADFTNHGSFVCNDLDNCKKLEHDAEYFIKCRENGIKSLAIIPVNYGHIMLGAIQFGSDAKNAISNDTIHVIENVSDMIGEAIQKFNIEEKLRETHEFKQVINYLLNYSLQNKSLEEILDKFLESILSMPWLENKSAGSIFLKGDKQDVFYLKAQKYLSEKKADTGL